MIWIKWTLGMLLLAFLIGVPMQLLFPHDAALLVGPAAVALIGLIWYYNSARIGVRIMKAQPLADRWLNERLAEYAAWAGLPQPPALYYIDAPIANAYALGRPGDSAVVLTTGLLSHLKSGQLIPILGHELHHIRARDTLFIIFSLVAGWILRVLSWIFMAVACIYGLAFTMLMAMFGGGGRMLSFVDFVRTMSNLAMRLNVMIAGLISREAELRADIAGARLAADALQVPVATGAEYMASALRAMERVNGESTPAGLTAALMSSHPPLKTRLKNLARLQRGE